MNGLMVFTPGLSCNRIQWQWASIFNHWIVVMLCITNTFLTMLSHLKSGVFCFNCTTLALDYCRLSPCSLGVTIYSALQCNIKGVLNFWRYHLLTDLLNLRTSCSRLCGCRYGYYLKSINLCPMHQGQR